MKKIILCVTMAFIITGCINRSPDQSPSELTKQQLIEKNQRCAKLQQQIKDLEGKPVRRTTAREYYQKECLLQNEAGYWQ